MPTVKLLLPYGGSPPRSELPLQVDELLLLDQCPTSFSSLLQAAGTLQIYSAVCTLLTLPFPMALPFPDQPSESEWSSEPDPAFSPARSYSAEPWHLPYAPLYGLPAKAWFWYPHGLSVLPDSCAWPYWHNWDPYCSHGGPPSPHCQPLPNYTTPSLVYHCHCRS